MAEDWKPAPNGRRELAGSAGAEEAETPLALTGGAGTGDASSCSLEASAHAPAGEEGRLAASRLT
jgi:hypothetical protein